MIKSQKINKINIQAFEGCSDYRKLAFGIYKNLLDAFSSKDLLLLESLGPKSSDAKRSMIGIMPIMKIEVINHVITIIGNNDLLDVYKSLFGDTYLIYSADEILRYQLADRTQIWDHLRVFDVQFKAQNNRILAFATFGYNTIHYIENIAGYVRGEIPDITLTCYSTYLEIGEGQVILHQYEFIGAEIISAAQITPHITISKRTSEIASNGAFFFSRETNKSEYIQKAKVALEHVARGDVYQIQIGHQVLIESNISPLAVYERLRLMNPSPYMYLFSCC